VSGLPVFRINPSDKFKRSYKELLKRHYKGDKAKVAFQDCVAQIVKDLSNNPSVDGSFLEPWPGSLGKPEEWEFRKYYFDMPSLRGASGQGRLMYLVNHTQGVIKLVWLYTHSEFPKRPPDKSLKQLLQELMESQEEQEPSSSNNEENIQ
jgi:mRNA-degrading endonuclease YafQ of YafQ-DinJ toxin-antitoxin module